MDQLPAALAGLAKYRQFMLWKAVWSEEKKKFEKFPVDTNTLAVVSAHDPAYWVDADTAIKRSIETGLPVAFVLTENDPFFFVDIDGCKTPEGQWSDLAKTLCTLFSGCAIEVSHSGKGLHVIGSSPPLPHVCTRHDIGLEHYTEKRFIALTGTQALGSVTYCPPGALENAVNTYFAPSLGVSPGSDVWTDAPVPEWGGPTDDGKLLEKMLKSKPGVGATFGNKATVAQLWEGDEDALGAAYPDHVGNRVFDHSAAELALCSHLAFWTGKDCERMDRLFRMSALNRDKWEEREEIRQWAIFKAVNSCKNVYSKKKKEPEPRVLGEPQPVTLFNSGPVIKTGSQFLGIPQQIELFKGCVYVRDLHCIFTPDGGLLKAEQFKAVFGGYEFAMDAENSKTTTNAYEAITESRAVRFPRARATCFRPEIETGALILEEDQILVNSFVPITTERRSGDVTPFLKHVKKMVPDFNDRGILIAYMAACVQHLGVKFQWTPLLQGMEGNGKTILINCISAAVGNRYTHLPNASDLGGNGAKFNSWIQNKLFIGVEEIYVSDRREVSDALKPLITNSRIEIQGKGANQVTGDNRANFFMCSNHKDAIMKTRGDRRYCVFFTAQQEAEDLTRDGMTGTYFPELYGWLRSGGYAFVSNYLAEYEIPEQMNPATMCTRSPDTTSTNEALAVSLGGVEQEILEAVEEGRPGFAEGWISSKALDRLLIARRDDRRIPPNKRGELLSSIGFKLHPGLKEGRVNNPIMQEGGKPRLYLRAGHIHANLSVPTEIVRHYLQAQGYLSSGVVDEAVNEA